VVSFATHVLSCSAAWTAARGLCRSCGPSRLRFYLGGPWITAENLEAIQHSLRLPLRTFSDARRFGPTRIIADAAFCSSAMDAPTSNEHEQESSYRCFHDATPRHLARDQPTGSSVRACTSCGKTPGEVNSGKPRDFAQTFSLGV
jgi:hypothetical protein